GLTVRTGDLICTTDGAGRDITGLFWRLIGKLIPGDVDHVSIFVGPGGRCVEAGGKGRVVAFEIRGGIWDESLMRDERGMFADTLYGVAYPLGNRGLPSTEEERIREQVAAYCLAQAEAGKPYNINFFNSSSENAFYCSQLAYRAYLKEGINLNTGRQVARIPGTENIILPQEIWDGCPHERPREA
ncbi:MAG TPA: hypothetical protein VGJ94_01465, partial [Syntrophorhabdaceae bacterium]